MEQFPPLDYGKAIINKALNKWAGYWPGIQKVAIQNSIQVYVTKNLTL